MAIEVSAEDLKPQEVCLGSSQIADVSPALLAKAPT
jgi:hypothetical protein